VHSRATSYKSIKSILENGLDRQPVDAQPPSVAHSVSHINVRGAGYYRTKGVTDAA
jgi:hypothetical protein